jgi:hypothetical protein
MRIKYPKAIQESEEELARLEQHLRGQKIADRVRMLRRLEKRNGEEFEGLCAVGRLQCDPVDAALGNAIGQRAWQGCLRCRSRQGRPRGCSQRRGQACWLRCERDTLRPCQTHAIIWSASGASATRTARSSGGSSRTIGANGRRDDAATRKPMPSNRPLLKKLRERSKAPAAQAGRSLR